LAAGAAAVGRRRNTGEFRYENELVAGIQVNSDTGLAVVEHFADHDWT
jgi:hypothetical protein